MSPARRQASSAKSGIGERALSQAASSSMAAGIGCSTSSTPRRASHSSLRIAVSLSFQPSFASTRSGLPVTLRTASIVASSLSSPTLILSTGNSAASRTFWRVISGRVDADRERRERRLGRVEAEQPVDRDPELLADPVVERDVERRARRVLALELAEGVAEEASRRRHGSLVAANARRPSSAWLPDAALSW